MCSACLRPREYDSTLRLRPGDKKYHEGAKYIWILWLWVIIKLSHYFKAMDLWELSFVLTELFGSIRRRGIWTFNSCFRIFLMLKVLVFEVWKGRDVARVWPKRVFGRFGEVLTLLIRIFGFIRRFWKSGVVFNFFLLLFEVGNAEGLSVKGWVN